MTADKLSLVYRRAYHRWSGLEFYDGYVLRCDRSRCAVCLDRPVCSVCPVCGSPAKVASYYCDCGAYLCVGFNTVPHKYVYAFAVLNPLFKTLEEDII